MEEMVLLIKVIDLLRVIIIGREKGKCEWLWFYIKSVEYMVIIYINYIIFKVYF